VVKPVKDRLELTEAGRKRASQEFIAQT
jgi:hypothetical protein